MMEGILHHKQCPITLLFPKVNYPEGLNLKRTAFWLKQRPGDVKENLHGELIMNTFLLFLIHNK